MEEEYFCGREDTTNNKVRVSYKKRPPRALLFRVTTTFRSHSFSPRVERDSTTHKVCIESSVELSREE